MDTPNYKTNGGTKGQKNQLFPSIAHSSLLQNMSSNPQQQPQQQQQQNNMQNSNIIQEISGQSNQKSKMLKFGDKILLSSTEQPQMFLGARSVIEERVYFIQEIDPSIQISAYENNAENTFSIYPKLNYDAEKRYNKTINQQMDEEEREILLRRVENEKLHNQKIIERHLNKPVTIGSEVLLFHTLSNSFIKCSFDKQRYNEQEESRFLNKRSQSTLNNEQDETFQNHFDLKLSQTLDGSIIFKIKIDPYYTFKKDGEPITYEDQFYFKCVKYNSNIVYKNTQRLNIFKSNSGISWKQTLTKIQEQKNNNFFSISQPGMNEKDNLKNLLLLENQQTFVTYQAGHTKKKKEINTFKAIHIQDANQKLDTDSKIIHWGDFVRIKHILRENTQQGFLSCAINLCGFSPKMFIQVRKKQDKGEKECPSSIFQIVPPNENLFGKPILWRKFKDQTKQILLFRHLLTGKFITWDEKQMTDVSLELGMSLDDYINSSVYLYKGIKDMEKNIRDYGTRPIKINQDLTKPEENLRQRKLLSDEGDQEFQKCRLVKQNMSHKLMNTKKEEQEQEEQKKTQSIFKQENGGNNKISDINYQNRPSGSKNSLIQKLNKISSWNFLDKGVGKKIQQFFDNNMVTINSSSSEEDHLTTSSCFSIQNRNNFSLNIEEDHMEPLIVQNYTQQVHDNKYEGFIDDSRYIKTWQQTNPLEQYLYSIIPSKENADFFFLSTVPEEEIQDFYSIQSKLHAIQVLSANPDNNKSQTIVQNALQSFIKLSLWLCNSNEKLISSINTVPIKERQAMLRETGVIDHIFKILYSLYHIQGYINTHMERDRPLIYKLCLNMIQFLKFLNYQNYYNSIYTFQWYPFLKEMITSPTIIIPSEMQIDELLKELFKQTDFSTSYEGNIAEIADGLEFSNHNNQALNLLIGFCLYSPTRSLDSYERMVKIIFEQKREKLFRDFLYDEELRVLINQTDSVKIDSDLETYDPEFFRYILSILALTSEICKGGNGSLILNYINNIFPFDICIKTFTNSRQHPKVRALFLDLFTSSYLAFDYRYSNFIQYPNRIVFQRGVQPDIAAQEILLEKQEEFKNKYNCQNIPSQASDFKESGALLKDKKSNKESQNTKNNFFLQLQSTFYLKDEKIDLKKFLLDYLNNLIEKQVKLKSNENQMIHSVVKVINYLMKKGFFYFQKQNDEISTLKTTMNKFLDRGFNSLSFGYLENDEVSKTVKKAKTQEIDPNNPLDINIIVQVGSTRNKRESSPRNLYKKQQTGIQEIQDYSNEKRTNELAEAEPWMTETIKSLLEIEKIQQNEVVKQFFSDKKNSSNFEEIYDKNGYKFNNKNAKNKDNNQKLQNKKLINEKISRVKDFLLKNETFVNEESEIKQYQKYLDILTLGDNKLSSSIVELISLIFSRKKNFLCSFNQITFIYDKNIHLYNSFLTIYNNLSVQCIDLHNTSFQNQKDSKSVKKIYSNLHDILLQLMKILFIDAEDPDTLIYNELLEAEEEETHKVPHQRAELKSKMYIDGSQKVDTLNLESENAPQNSRNGGDIIGEKNMEIPNHQLRQISEQDSSAYTPVDSKRTFKNQESMPKFSNFQKHASKLTSALSTSKKMKNMFLFKDQNKIIWNILDIFQFDITQAYKIQDMLRHMNFHEKIIEIINIISGKIGAKKDESQADKQVILEKCLIFLIYFLMKNVGNQNIIAEFPQFEKLLSDVLSLRIKNLQTYILIFISEIYKDNYHLLISMNKQNGTNTNQLFTKLKLKLAEELPKKNYAYCIYFFQLLLCFFKIKQAQLIQNSQWIFEELFQSDNLDFQKHFLQQIEQIKSIDIKQQFKGTRIFVPDSILFVCIVINITRQLVSTQSANSQIIGVVKQFFSVLTIEEILRNLQEWYPLKLELVSFFIEVYLNTKKLEENEIKKIRQIFRETLYEDLLQYVEYLEENNGQGQYENKYFQNIMVNVFNHTTSYSTTENIMFISYDQAQQNYIIFGIIEALECYISMFISNYQDDSGIDIEILEQFNALLDRLAKVWDINLDEIDHQTKFQIIDLKKKSVHLQSLAQRDNQQRYSINSPIDSRWNSPNKNQFVSPNKRKSEMSYNTMNNNIVGRDPLAKENKASVTNQKKELNQKIYIFKNTQIYLERLKALTPNDKYEFVEQMWDKIRARQTQVISNQLIQNYNEQETNDLVQILVQIKKEDAIKFKQIIQSLIEILTDDQSEIKIKVKTMKILRSLANFRNDLHASSSIHRDLCDLGFTDFLCEVISKDANPNSKLEYILCLCDFLDEGDFEIQKSLLEYLKRDTENVFLQTIHQFIVDSFEDFKEYEKGLKQTQQDKIQGDIRQVINKKIYNCSCALMLLKLACEGHYEDMQNYLREQVYNGKKLSKSINMIQLGADLFRDYIKVVNHNNIQLGEMILDYVIEVLQGPCENNQLCLCETKILEDIEDIIFRFSQKSIQQNKLGKIDLDMSGFTKRIYTVLLALAEGSQDQYLLEKIGNFLNPKILLKRLMLLYYKALKSTKKDIKDNLIHQDKKEKKIIQNYFNAQSEQEILKNIEENNMAQEGDIQILIDLHEDLLMNDVQWDEYLTQSLKNLQEEGLNIYILLKTLGQQSNGVKRKIKSAKNEIIQLTQHEIKNKEQMKNFQKLQQQQQKKANPNGRKNEIQSQSSPLKAGSYEKEQVSSSGAKKSEKKSEKRKKTFNIMSSFSGGNMQHQDKLNDALRHYKNNVGRIEIVNSLNEVQVLYFPKPQITKNVSRSSKIQFLHNVNRDSANDKINGLLNHQQNFINEMQHNQYLNELLPFINFEQLYQICRSLVLLLVFVLNFLILFDSFVEECDECTQLLREQKQCVCDEQDYKTDYSNEIKGLGMIVLVLNIAQFFFWAVLQLKLDQKKFQSFFFQYLKSKDKNKYSAMNKQSELKLDFGIQYKYSQLKFREKIQYYAQKVKYFTIHSYFVYLILYAGITALGLYFSRLFFGILLLDIIDRSITLKNVIKSITLNFDQLGMTGILGVVIMFFYAMIAFYSQYIRSTMETFDYEEPICDTPIMCFMYTINIGLRAGGGVGEPLIQPDPYNSPNYFARFFFDLTFFLIISIIWMNIIFGIIIDTFAELRDLKTLKDQDSRNKCFICSIERTLFEKQGYSFEVHTEKHHNVWDYLHYIVYLRHKDQIDYNGTESYVAEKIKNDDISWFPIGVSITLSQIEDTEDQQIKKLLQTIDNNLSNYILHQRKYLSHSENSMN